MTCYWKTKDENGVVSTHLSEGGDHAICGQDLIGGDPVAHSGPVVEIGKKSRITCPHCRQIIELVKDHLAGKLN